MATSLLTLALPALVHAQASARAIPATYAITNARIVSVAGRAIEKGTIVIRDGLIAAVGATIAVPGDARIIDGTGLVVYPGFIDAYGSVGVATSGAPTNGAGASGRGGGGFGAAPTTARSGAANSSYPAGLQPEVNVVELLKANADAMSGQQSAGFMSAYTGAARGSFRARRR